MFKKLVLGLITLGAVPGWATTSYFVGASTESAFDSAVLGGGLTASAIINFSGATGGGTNTVTQSGQTFFGVSGTLSVTGSNRLQENYNGSGTRMDVTPGSNVYALGLHLLTSSGSGVFCFEAPGAGDCGFDVNGGLAVFSSTVNFFGIVSSNPLGEAMAQKLGQNEAVLLWGHGITLTAKSLPEAIHRVIALRANARMQLAATSINPASLVLEVTETAAIANILEYICAKMSSITPIL